MNTTAALILLTVTTYRLYRTLTAGRRNRRDAAMYADTDI